MEKRSIMKLIIGLGNPTKAYEGTRHNIGFDVITELSRSYQIPLDQKGMKAIYGKGMIANQKVIIMKPQTYMNLSGESVRAALDFYKLTSNDILVIYDDISLAVGQLRLRKKGSAGGHNGIKNIIAHLSTQEFERIRVGVGEKPKDWDLADYVLGHFSKEDSDIMREAEKRAAKACEVILSEGFDAAMNCFNQREA